MYVREANWYQKQLKRKAHFRKVSMWFALVIGLLMIPVCFCALQVCAQDFIRENLATTSAMIVPYEMIQKLPQQETARMQGLAGRVNEELMKKAEIVASLAAREEIQQTNVVEKTGQFVIVIDPGHGGEDEGASFQTVEEKEINFQLAKKLQEKLEAMDFQVLLTRERDVRISMEERVKIANEAEADLFISIHQNTCAEESAAGVETYYFPSKEGENKRLAQLAEQYVVLYTQARDRGVKEAENLYVIRESNMPSCLIETGFLSNEQERTLLQEEAYLNKIAQGLADAVELYFYPKVMYLTFDDGPVAGNTEQVLDILKERNMKATFFVVGENVERNPELAKRIVEEGHTIGIHCYHHDYKKLYAGVDSYMEDFEKAKAAVYEATGVEPKLFRFPGGSVNSYNRSVYKEIIQEMTEAGYVYFDWNASFEDAVRNITTEKIMQNAVSSTLGRKKVVMLAHDMVDETVACLEKVLELFPEYEMKALGEDVEPVQF